MKNLLVFVMLLLPISTLAAETVKTPFVSADKVVWAGVDYSHARFIGPGQFANPGAIFPGMLDAWNQLVLRERLRHLEKALRKPVITDIAGVMEINQSANASQIVNAPGPDDTVSHSQVTPNIIVGAVRSYKLKNTSGVAVVFIVDRLVKLNKKGEGAVYVVAFDLATRKVFFSQRVVSKAAGFGFRNYWFRVIKNSEKALRRIR
jgi:hypothetical protein